MVLEGILVVVGRFVEAAMNPVAATEAGEEVDVGVGEGTG